MNITCIKKKMNPTPEARTQNGFVGLGNTCEGKSHRMVTPGISTQDETRRFPFHTEGIWPSPSVNEGSLEKKRSLTEPGHEEFQTICPVCGGILCENNLPNVESVITDGILFCSKKDRIINSRVLIEHKFNHFYNEDEDCTLVDPHTLISVIEAEFDGSGHCIAFSVVRVYPPVDQ
ncbi:MAG: hypothetical protein WBA22_01155 [Candidatus Methanofastidiosia archaeon]